MSSFGAAESPIAVQDGLERAVVSLEDEGEAPDKESLKVCSLVFRTGQSPSSVSTC